MMSGLLSIIENSTCMRMDFKFNAMPCKYMFAAMQEIQELQLPGKFRDSILFYGCIK